MKQLWVEKYRPKILEDMCGQDHITPEMVAIVESDGASMQNFLFYSPEPGTGKTSLAYALAAELDYQVHKFNASSKRTRGIDFVEEDVAPLSRTGIKETIMFLDEADRLTTQAQDALKGVIEDATAYFILTCNDLSRISPWLQSRCQLRTFKPIDDESLLKRLAWISANEGLEITEGDLQRICSRHTGDLRNAINALQSFSCLPEEQKQQFLLTLDRPFIDSNKVLRLCFKERCIDLAVAELTGDPRQAIRAVFDHAIATGAKDESKLRVIDAAITSERDIINGVEPSMVLHNFCRMLIEGV